MLLFLRDYASWMFAKRPWLLDDRLVLEAGSVSFSDQANAPILEAALILIQLTHPLAFRILEVTLAARIASIYLE